MSLTNSVRTASSRPIFRLAAAAVEHWPARLTVVVGRLCAARWTSRSLAVLRAAWAPTLLLVAVSIPFLGVGDYYIHLLVLAGLLAVLGLGSNFMQSLVGEANFALGSLYGVGAFTVAFLTVHLGWTFWPAGCVAIIASSVAAVIIGLPALRTSGLYFAIVTLGLGAISTELFSNLTAVTGGVAGTTNIARPPDFFWQPSSVSFSEVRGFYLLVVAAVAVFAAINFRLLLSPIGRRWAAIGQDELLARSLGMYVMPYKLTALAIAGAAAGVAGALYASYIGFISPDAFTFWVAFQVLLVIALGGGGTVAGPILASLFMVYAPELLDIQPKWRLVAFSLLLLAVILSRPKGILARR